METVEYGVFISTKVIDELIIIIYLKLSRMNSKSDFIDRFQTKGYCAAFGEVCYDQCLKDELTFSKK